MPKKRLRVLDVLGTPLCVTDYHALIEHCQEMTRESGVYAIDFTNTHIITLRRHSSSFRNNSSCFDLFIPDGMPLVWCLNRRGARLHDRIYGPTFMRRCLIEASSSITNYFLGGSDSCVRLLKKKILTFNPSANIVGMHHGYFNQSDESRIRDEINKLRPDLIWVGLGTPKQQEWICRNKKSLTHGVLLAVGFAFDVNAGLKRDAPLRMQRYGLTWVFRAFSEPARLLQRYLTYNSLFLFYLIKDSIWRRKWPRV